MKQYWNRFLNWRGWKILFPLPLWTAALLFAACCAGLIWIFVQGLDTWWPAYVLYAASAYSLTALCVRIPEGIRTEQTWLHNHPKLYGALKDRDLKFRIKLYSGQILNFAYGIFKIASGVVIGSAWIGADGIYNLTQAMIQLFQILRHRKPGTLAKQWRSYRLCGWLLLLVHLTLIGIVFQMVNWNRVDEAGEIMIIATATFAFYKLIGSLIRMAKDRKHPRPVESSVRMLELSQAIFAMFSLQAGLLHVYGTGEIWEHLLNLAVGCLVCLLTVMMGIYMIRRANREIKTLQEKENGTEFL